MSKHTTLEQLKLAQQRTKTEVGKVSTRVKTLEDVGAQANVIEHIKLNGVELTIQSGKIVDITVPTKVSDLTNDSSFQTATQVAAAVAAAGHLKRTKVDSVSNIDTSAADADQYIYMVPKTGSDADDVYDEYMVMDGSVEHVGNTKVDLSGYVKKETGKGLSANDFTTELKTKLEGIAEGANNYTHPTHDAHASGFYKITVDASGHVSAVTVVTKEDITDLGIPGQDTTYSNATTSADGLMSSADKLKLDGIETATDAEVTAMLNEVWGTPTNS